MHEFGTLLQISADRRLDLLLENAATQGDATPDDAQAMDRYGLKHSPKYL